MLEVGKASYGGIDWVIVQFQSALAWIDIEISTLEFSCIIFLLTHKLERWIWVMYAHYYILKCISTLTTQRRKNWGNCRSLLCFLVIKHVEQNPCVSFYTSTSFYLKELTACPLLYEVWCDFDKINYVKEIILTLPVLCQWTDEWLFWKSQIWIWSLSLRPCLNLHVHSCNDVLQNFSLFPMQSSSNAMISLKCPNAGVQINLEDCCKAAPIRFAWSTLEKHCCRINNGEMQRNCCKIQQQWLFAKKLLLSLGTPSNII